MSSAALLHDAPPRSQADARADRAGGEAGSRRPSLADDWETWRRSGSRASRDRLVAHYMEVHVRPIAARVRRTLPAAVDVDDLVQQGYLGLIDAMQRFDAKQGVRFETFSSQRIIGAMHDYLRAIDPMPRLRRQRTRQLADVTEAFEKIHGRPPSADDLRAALDAPEDEVRRVLRSTPTATVPFSTIGAGSPGGADPVSAIEDPSQRSPLTAAQREDLKQWLTHGLSRRDRLIVVLYYYEQLTMREIGRTLGISESRVSQRLELVLQMLRARCRRASIDGAFIAGR